MRILAIDSQQSSAKSLRDYLPAKGAGKFSRYCRPLKYVFAKCFHLNYVAYRV
jgi:hypothetical protein